MAQAFGSDEKGEGGTVGSQVYEVEVRGRGVRAQRHVGVLQLLGHPAQELLADAVELHDVAWVLVDPELMELLHQVTYKGGERKPTDT